MFDRTSLAGPGAAMMFDKWQLAFLLTLLGMLAITYAANWLNGYLVHRRWQLWQRIILGLLLLSILALATTAACFRTHLWLIEVGQMPELLRRAYGTRLLVGSWLALLFIQLQYNLRQSRRLELARAEEQVAHSRAQLNSLQNQLQPHFLFNALNSLSAAIRKGDRERSLQMVDDLADSYRYMLQVRDRPLSSVADELRFLQSYITMQTARFGPYFSVQQQLPLSMMERQLPSLALQLLVENVVKHNEISSSRPLALTISSSDGAWIEVRNQRQPKLAPNKGEGTGLSNLRRRYQLLLGLDDGLRIEQTATTFSVHLMSCP
ncbi:MAG: histidine kinase [Bacteroidota bacterium]